MKRNENYIEKERLTLKIELEIMILDSCLIGNYHFNSITKR